MAAPATVAMGRRNHLDAYHLVLAGWVCATGAVAAGWVGAVSGAGLTGAAAWEDAGEAFTATNGVWTLEEPFEGMGTRFYRLIWWKE